MNHEHCNSDKLTLKLVPALGKLANKITRAYHVMVGDTYKDFTYNDCTHNIDICNSTYVFYLPL